MTIFSEQACPAGTAAAACPAGTAAAASAWHALCPLREDGAGQSATRRSVLAGDSSGHDDPVALDEVPVKTGPGAPCGVGSWRVSGDRHHFIQASLLGGCGRTPVGKRQRDADIELRHTGSATTETTTPDKVGWVDKLYRFQNPGLGVDPDRSE